MVCLIDQLPNRLQALPRTFYMDNLFTGMSLIKEMSSRNYGFIGTMRENRIPKFCPVPPKKIMSKKERGTSHVSFDEANEIVIVKWMDNSCVSMASNCTGKFPLKSAQRWNRTTKTRVQVCILLILCFSINCCSIHNLLHISDRSAAMCMAVQSKHGRN